MGAKAKASDLAIDFVPTCWTHLADQNETCSSWDTKGSRHSLKGTGMDWYHGT